MIVRGFLFLSTSQVVFVLTGFVIQLGLARILGPEQYGVYSVVISILVWIRMSIFSGVPVAMQKYTAENVDEAFSLRDRALKVQLIYSFIIFSMVLLLSDPIGRAFKDPSISYYIKIISFDIVLFGLYKFYSGFQNGLRRFGKQAILAIVYSIVKVIVIFSLLSLGLSLVGAFIGNLIASCSALFLGLYFSRGSSEGKPATQVTVRSLISFSIPTTVYALLINLFSAIGLWLTKYFLGDSNSGFFNAANTIARMPRVVFLALTFVLLPSLSRSLAQKNLERVKEYIVQSYRLVLMLLLPIVIIISNASESIIEVLFSNRYQVAAGPLQMMVVGLFLLTLFVVMKTTLVADGRVLPLIMITVIMIGAEILLGIYLIPRYGIEGAGIAMAIAAFIGSSVICTCVAIWYRGFLSFISLLKFGLAGGVVYFLTSVYQPRGLGLVPYSLILYALYLGLLFVMKEVTLDDIDRVRNSIKVSNTVSTLSENGSA